MGREIFLLEVLAVGCVEKVRRKRADNIVIEIEAIVQVYDL